MHNCGHDIHTALLLGTAAVLFRNPDKLTGKVVFLFQPAEEVAGGADDIVAEGVLKALGVQKIFAQHVAPGMPVGTISLSPGTPLAGSSYFKLRLKGRSSHAATPFEGDDLPLLASKIVQELSNLPARRIDIANRPVVVSVTKVEAVGSASNILPSQAEISGTVRTFEDPMTSHDGNIPIADLLRLTVERFSTAVGVTHEWEFRRGAPPTTNDHRLFDQVAGALRGTWLGTFDTRPTRGMVSEDFGYYTQVYPALYFGLGIAKDGQGEAGVHTMEFTTSPAAFPYGVRLLVNLAQIGTIGTASWD
jgi:amidohydrolase